MTSLPLLMRPFLLALTVLALAPSLRAQTPVRRDTLPPLAPRDLEIRGELRVALPSIERQPLTAFGLAPRLKTVDSRRTVPVPSYVTPAIPGSALGAPVLPQPVSLDPGTPRRGTFEAGVGRAYARFGHLYFARTPAPGTGLFADAVYEGLSGFRPNGLPATHADAGRLLLGVRHARGPAALGATLDADVRSRGLYGVGPFVRRGGATGGLTLDAEGRIGGAQTAGATLGGALRVSGGRYDPAAFESREAHLDASLHAVADQTPVGLWLDAGTRVGRLDGTKRVDQFTLSAGAGVHLHQGEGTLRAGPRVLLANETFHPRALTLDLDGRYALAPGFAALLQNTPRISGGRYADVFEESPFAVARPEVRSEVVPVDARAGVLVTRGTTETTVWAGFRRFTQARIYEQPTGFGLVQASYAALRELTAGATVRLMQLDGFHALATVEGRSTTFAAADLDTLTVPYRAPVEGSVQIGYRLPQGKGLLQATLHSDGVRYADREASRRVAPTADLDLFASYGVTPYVNLIGRLDNVLAGGRERWMGFPEARLLGQVGLSVRW